MKKMKRGLAAILVGEFVTLWHKDKKFKKGIQEAGSWTDKAKVAFEGLLNFNKDLVDDLQKTNLEEAKKKALAWFEKETAMLEDKISTWENEFAQRSDEKMPIYMMGLEDQFKKFEKKALVWKDRLVDEYELEKTVDMFNKRITHARKHLEDSTGNSNT